MEILTLPTKALPPVPVREVGSLRPTWDGRHCKEQWPTSIVKIYNKTLNQDRNWKGLWEEFSHSMSSPVPYRKNCTLSTWLYSCNSPFPRLSLPLYEILSPSLFSLFTWFAMTARSRLQSFLFPQIKTHFDDRISNWLLFYGWHHNEGTTMMRWDVAPRNPFTTPVHRANSGPSQC